VLAPEDRGEVWCAHRHRLPSFDSTTIAPADVQVDQLVRTGGSVARSTSRDFSNRLTRTDVQPFSAWLSNVCEPCAL
jgi:hypothetical protein